MWILILNLSYSTQSAVTHSIPNFQTREACVAAGDAWLVQKYKSPLSQYREALCVKDR